MTTALIDADALVYRAAAVAEKKFAWNPGDEELTVLVPQRAREVALYLVRQWTKQAGCRDAELIFSDRTARRTSFRYTIHPHYKAQREDMVRPELLQSVEAWAMDHFEGRYHPGLEGDDLMGVMATKGDHDYVIVSPDKDMLTIPAKVMIVPHWSQTLEDAEVLTIPLREADRNVALQAITGDTTDNFKGAPGIGKGGAAKHLWEAADKGASWFTAVLSAFAEAWATKPRYHDVWVHPGDPMAEALMNMRCAYILRDGDVDGTRVRLWTPKGAPERWLEVR